MEPGVAPAPSEPKSVVKLGLVATLSGPVGPDFLTHAQGTQLWNQSVNSRGGVAGHRVQLIVADDGGDPARHKALVQDLVENQHVLAFVGNLETVVGPSAVEYLNAKRIPVIGLQGGEVHAYSSPMYFPQASSGQAYYDTMFASWGQRGNALGKRKFAIFACVEAEVCQEIYNQTDAQTRKRNLDAVYKARISLAQPDFTAECLGARNAGVELLFVLADGNTQGRVAESCDRQGFRPTFVSAAEAIYFDAKDNQKLNGLIARTTTIPFISDSPLNSEFRSAFRRFGSKISPAFGLMIGWVSGKLFEKAAAQLPEPPTTEAILHGLWSLKGDDLGGITGPLTFVQDQAPKPIVCWWNVEIRTGKWQSPDNSQRFCA